MKKLNEHLIESLLDDEEELVNDDNILIDQFLKDNYEIDGAYTIKNGIVDVNGNVRLSIKVQRNITDLTNELFKFGIVTGNFVIMGCKKLKSLKGCPYKVNSFHCYNCSELENFIGAPSKIDDFMGASGCTNVISLIGLPKTVKKIDLSGCKKLKNLEYISDSDIYVLNECIKLESLKGLPSNHKFSLYISNCKKLRSLEGCYKHMHYLNISRCKLDNFNGGPETLSDRLYMDYTEVKSLDGFPKSVEWKIEAIKATLPISLDQFKNDFVPKNCKCRQVIC